MVEAADSLPAGNARQQQTSALGRARATALGSCGRAPHHIAVCSSPARANGSTAAPSARRTTTSARLEIGGDWVSVGLVGRLAWWFLRPSATRRVFFLPKRHPPSMESPAPSAVLPPRRGTPPPLSPSTARALGSRPSADLASSASPAAEGTCRAAGLQPASSLHRPQPRPWVPAGRAGRRLGPGYPPAAAAGTYRPPRP
ncbi:hypothetical protein PVAP13_8KG072302 [Panicum virgatum]|uniref:Uncharacterized protein n=1 Tax=Panicum virgatum TaxID=38727 RepID=A0A8T0PMF0_PANVG|nr:hypothetical protein PVAP13_8KG072302 [Panicum virgatum]